MLRFPPKLRHEAASDFLGSTVATRILRKPTFKASPCSCISADDIDAGGIAIVTGVLDESIWPYLYANAAEKLHGGPSSFLATVFDMLKPLDLPPPPPPKKRKSWVPGRFLDASNKKWLGRLLLGAGAVLVAGVVIGAIIILAEPLMKLFAFIGNLLLMAGGFIGSVIMAIAQCMADHGLACPIHGIMMILKGAARLAGQIGGWVVNGLGKLFGKLLFGVMMLGGFALAKLGALFKGIWFGIGTAFKAAWGVLGKLFHTLWSGILGLAGFMVQGAAKLFLGGLAKIRALMKKINIGGILMGIVMGIGAIGYGIMKLGAAIPGLALAALKGIGGMFAKLGHLDFKNLIPSFIFSGITLALAGLGKLGSFLGNSAATTGILLRQFFLKGLPKMFEWMLGGAHALLLAGGVALGAFFDKLKDLPGLEMPDWQMPGLEGIGELMLTIGGTIGHLLLTVGSAFINVVGFGLGMAIAGLEAGWHFAGKMLAMIGPLTVKFFMGVLWLAKMIYDALGHMVLGALALIGAAAGMLVKGLGKLFGGLGKLSLAVITGAFKLAIGALKALPGLIPKAFAAIGMLFKHVAFGAYVLTVGIGELIGDLVVHLGKFGFSVLTLPIRALMFLIPVLWKSLGFGLKMAFKGFGKFFDLVFRGIALGFSFTLKGFDKFFDLMKLGFGFMLSMPKFLMKLPDFSLAGLKALWGAIKMGGFAMYKFAVGFGKMMLWILKNPRVLLTALVLLAYVAFLCFGMGYCQRYYSRPGWGQVPPPDNAGSRPARYGWKVRGGRGRFRLTWPGKDKPETHKWMDITVPAVKERDVRREEALGNGKDLLIKPRLYESPDLMNWDKKIGEFQTVETDKSGAIVSTDIATNEYWNCGGSRSRIRTIPAVYGHPRIQLSQPVSGIRVQLYDIDSGELNWDATYQLRTPGLLDKKAIDVSGKTSWLPGDKGAAPGFSGFNRLCIPKGDQTDHEYELLVTRYPPYANTKETSDHLQEQNHLGTAHYKAWVVADPRVPSEEAAKQDSSMLSRLGKRIRGQDVGLTGAVISIVSPSSQAPDCSAQKVNLPTYQHWRRERHKQFWTADSAEPQLNTRHLSVRRSANFLLAPSSAGLVAQW